MKSFLPNDIKDQNRKIIFDILHQELELAKVEVTERTTMSFVTVSKIMDFFQEIGIVTVNGESREGSGGLGRKRVIYSFNANSYTTIGIQVIGNKLSAVLVNLHSEVIATYESAVNIAFWKKEFIAIVKEIVVYFQAEALQYQARIIGIGIGIDGAIHEEKKTLKMRSEKNKEEDYEYEAILEQIKLITGLPVVLENDVNASTIAQFSYLDRGGDGPNDLLQIALGDGIGGGIILDKKLYRGRHAGAGELEYMCFDLDYSSAPSSVGWLESKLNLDDLSRMYEFDVHDISRMSIENKDTCITYISKYLALAICNMVSLLNIQSIILSGKTISIFPTEIQLKTKEFIKQYTGWDLHLMVSIKRDCTAVGAAILALQNEMCNIISGEGMSR
ncbi:MAG: ROK family protein [Turicibacter sp.]